MAAEAGGRHTATLGAHMSHAMSGEHYTCHCKCAKNPPLYIVADTLL